ncbi:MAG: ABC transporter ATP-binding protein [Candidatus Omnitrophica bacterium]|jgi:ABC-type transport system involved in resistance to organic solvents, ATPase component|nr:ABC transporter ATP-binding protein [Candidatus Omnitrophota bacterium]
MIAIKELHKSFGGQPVLRGTTLQIKKGETLVIIGRSGCGKSVLLKHIIGILQPDRGTITVDGQNVSALKGKDLVKLRMKFGMLFQGAALFDSLSVYENVGFALLEHTRLSQEEIRGRVAQSLESVDLAHIEEKKPAELSGGMKKRVGLARAICNNPQIILYDEPTTGLDPIMADMINDLIVRLHKQLKVTSVVVTHDMKSAYKVGTRIAMLYEGVIIAQGTPDEIRNSPDPIVQQFISGAAHGPITDKRQNGAVSYE